MKKRLKYAFRSGIGDNDDLQVKQPAGESQSIPFQYAARLRGRKRNEVMMYPELNFNYSIQYKGDLYVEDNESPYKVSIDAYPGKKFDYKITQTRRLPIERDYEVKMEIGGVVGSKTVEYRANWAAGYQVTEKIDSKSLFDARNRKGDYIGAGAQDVWQLSPDGSYVYETVNRTHFSGMIANEYYNKTDYRIRARFRPILSTIDDYAIPFGDDDDVVCLIFRAKDKRNFYMAMWERHERTTNSWRISSDLEGADIFTGNDNGEWNRYMVKSQNYAGKWDTYVNETGWKNDHMRVYKVVDGKMYRVAVSNNMNRPGWKMQQDNYIEAFCFKNTTSIRIQLPGQQLMQVFEIKTDWDYGSFGIANFSQAVQFHEITFDEWKDISGSTDWESYSGSNEKVVHSSSENYVMPSIRAKIKTLTGDDSKEIWVFTITPEVKDPTTGSMTAGIGLPVKVKAFSPPNAGQIVSKEYTKSGKAFITPDNISRETALVVIDSVDRWFTNEIAQFKQENAEIEKVEIIYTLLKPVLDGSTAQFSWDHERLTMWNPDPETIVTTKEFSNTIYAYQDWVTINDLSAFERSLWVEYKLEVFNNSTTVNPEYDQIRWASTGSSLVTTNPNDVLRAKTTEWYKGIFPADISNEGVVSNRQPIRIQIPPMPEHYVEPYKGTAMPYIYEDVHYLMYKHPIGKQHVWMYWESNPSVTTRTAMQINPMTQQPIIMTKRMDDHVVVVCDPDPRYIAWNSGQYIGYGKVNGKRPFMSGALGKADMIDVPADVVFLPENLQNVQGPFIQVSDPRINYSYNELNKTITFSSDFMDKYEWFTDWATDWKEDPREFVATRDKPILITDPVVLNPLNEPDYDHNVIIDRIEVTSNNPFVGTWIQEMPSDTEGLFGSYYRTQQSYTIAKQAFTVGGNFKVKEQIFEVNEAIEDVRTDGQPAAETFLPVDHVFTGTIYGDEEVAVASITVPEGQEILKVVASFMVAIGSQHPELNIIAPDGERFGMRYENGTWSEDSVELTDCTSCETYTFTGEYSGSEVMTFEAPIPGEWRIVVYNSGASETPYTVTCNMEAEVASKLTLRYAPDPWSVAVYINGVSTAGFILDGKEVHISDPIEKTDVVRVEYNAGGVTVIGLPMRTRFTMQESMDPNILSVEMDGVAIPNDPDNGYTLTDKIFELHGAAAKPGTVKIRYSVGDIQNVFVLNHNAGQGIEVYINGKRIDSTKYGITGVNLTIQKELLRPNDWVHIQSYIPGDEFDWSKDNDLGEFQFSRIDPKIDFDWGAGSPFEMQAAAFAAMSVEPQFVPQASEEPPQWDDYRESRREYLEPDAPATVQLPRQPEPYIPQLQVPEDDTPNDGFAINWRGYLVAPATGQYLIHATVDDGFRLWVDNQLIIDAWMLNEKNEYTGSIMLEGGKMYMVNINYFENTGNASVKLEWTTPDGSREVIPSSAFRPYMGYQVLAQIKEATPLPWSPMIHSGYYYFQEREHYLFAKPVRLQKTPVDHQILIQPRPQQGAPVILRSNKGVEWRKVTFYDSSWKMTLENTEEFNGNGSSQYYLQYRDIDPDTIKVTVNGKAQAFQFDPQSSLIRFDTAVGFDDIIVVKYKLMNSYMLDYNYDVENDVARIVLHENYNLSDMIGAEIIYESASDTPFYRANEIIFNPILNHNHRGFLYLTEQTDEAVESIYLHVSPRTLPADGATPALISARIKDMHGNPIEQKEVSIYRDGTLIYAGKTNQAGEVYVLDRPIPPNGLVSKYEAVCEEKMDAKLMNYYKPDISDRFFIQMETSKAAIMAGQEDEVTIMLTLRDENWQPVSDRSLKVSYKDTKGITRSIVLTTGNDGSVAFSLSAINETKGIMTIQATFDMGGELASSVINVRVIGG